MAFALQQATAAMLQNQGCCKTVAQQAAPKIAINTSLCRRNGASRRAALCIPTCVCFQTSTPVFSSSWVQFELIRESKVRRTWARIPPQPCQMRVRRRRHCLVAPPPAFPCSWNPGGLGCFRLTKFSVCFSIIFFSFLPLFKS